MSCSSPISIINSHDKSSIFVPCYYCSSCLSTRINQISYLASRQFLYYWLKKGQNSSFVTLTYNDDHLPLNDFGTSTLRRRDLINFIKRFRINIQRYNKTKLLPHRKIPIDFKILYSGEYGEDRGRPHYHIIFLGLNESQVKTVIGRSWFRMCRIDIGPLSHGGIRYVCKYIDKQDTPDKCVKALRDSLSVESPFFYHSTLLSLPWIVENMDRIIKNKFQFNLNGKTCFYPKYVIKFICNQKCIDYKPIILRSFLEKYGPKFIKSPPSSWNYSDMNYCLVRLSQEQKENLQIKEFYQRNALISKCKPVSSALLLCRSKPVSHSLRSDYINNLIKQIGGKNGK